MPSFSRRLRSSRAFASSVSRWRTASCSCPEVSKRLRTWRTVFASEASACSSATFASAVSSCTSGVPAFTKSVSFAAIFTTVPGTCEVIWTTSPFT